MPYEIRNFHIQDKQHFFENNQIDQKYWIKQTYPDIYVFKRNSANIGVKFRDIQSKKYGYKILSVEVKINKRALQIVKQVKEKLDMHLDLWQQWIKYEIDFKYKLLEPRFYQSKEKLQEMKENMIEKKRKGKEERKISGEEENKRQEKMQGNLEMKQDDLSKFSSYEEQLRNLNSKLVKEMRKHLCKKEQMKGYLEGENVLTNWLREESQIEELFVVRKKKNKSWNWETGRLTVQKFSQLHFVGTLRSKRKDINLEKLYFQTVSAQSRDPVEIKKLLDQQKNRILIKEGEGQNLSFNTLYNHQNKEKNFIKSINNFYKFSTNTSYPQLLQDLNQHFGSS